MCQARGAAVQYHACLISLWKIFPAHAGRAKQGEARRINWLQRGKNNLLYEAVIGCSEPRTRTKERSCSGDLSDKMSLPPGREAGGSDRVTALECTISALRPVLIVKMSTAKQQETPAI